MILVLLGLCLPSWTCTIEDFMKMDSLLCVGACGDVTRLVFSLGFWTNYGPRTISVFG